MPGQPRRLIFDEITVKYSLALPADLMCVCMLVLYAQAFAEQFGIDYWAFVASPPCGAHSTRWCPTQSGYAGNPPVPGQSHPCVCGNTHLHCWCCNVASVDLNLFIFCNATAHALLRNRGERWLAQAYPPPSHMFYAQQLYLDVTNRTKSTAVKFCLVMDGNQLQVLQQDMARIVGYFHLPTYQTVLGGQ